MVARTKSTVLVTGETGTGKELVARAIHHRSAQREMPLIKVNCAAIPDTLLESELFGHVRGAFTGAPRTRRASSRSPTAARSSSTRSARWDSPLQAKLLRVLQEREFEPLGSERPQQGRRARRRRHQPRPAPDGDGGEVPGGSVLPAQRDSDRDSAAARAARGHPGAGRALRRKHAQRSGRPGGSSREAALAALERYDWPGNVRELENTIERAVVLSRDAVIGADAISGLRAPRRPRRGLPSMRLHQNLEWVERETVRRALDVPAASRRTRPR